MEIEEFLKKFLKEKNFCLVGNAPNEIGKNKGIEIDKFEYIFRFNDYSLKYEKDYGSKVNFWIRASNDLVIETLNQKNYFDHDMIFLRAYNQKNESSRKVWEKRGQKYLIFPIEYEAKLSKLLGSIPSTGLLMLYILKENGYILTKKNIFGFSFFDEKDLVQYGSHHYFSQDSQEEIGIAQARHAWDKEKIFFKNHILGKL